MRGALGSVFAAATKEDGATHLLGKAHLQEAVRFVQHQRGEVLQVEGLAVAQVVDQPPL